MRNGRCNHCPVCGENYDFGEIHRCEGRPADPPPVERVDKHLEACRRAGQYVQPGYRLGPKSGSA